MAALFVLAALALAGAAMPPRAGAAAPLTATTLDRALLPNPYAHIPGQCYVETSDGLQNACQYCHTDGLSGRRFGNNTPQAGSSAVLGNLQADYAFPALHYPHLTDASVNPWENTLFPDRLTAAMIAIGQDPDAWDMESWVATDNWSPAFAKRPGDPRRWDGGVADPFRLFPGLDPADLPADADGFVRSARSGHGFFAEKGGWNTGWRAVDFVPYGIFTPLTGSVSGIYIRLPEAFMTEADGRLDGATYAANLDLVARAVEDRLDGAVRYRGAAAAIPVEPGLYPVGTEFAHPLHYVDTRAPGLRARRVKEVRYMYKARRFDPAYGSPDQREEDAPIRVGENEAWIDNGAGWILAGFIEDADGALRPQTPGELLQCAGCHSGAGPQDEIAYADFASGTGNTVDSTWALPRQLPGAAGWREMSVLGYRPDPEAPAQAAPGRATVREPQNRKLGRGEYRHFLDTVVGASLYGEMPPGLERVFGEGIRSERGYAADWPALDTTSAEAFLASQRLRRDLLRAFTARDGHLEADGTPAAPLLYPSRADALEAARRYRMVVATQRFDKGKDVFPETPLTLRYFRTEKTAFSHRDGRPYRLGEPVTDRPVNGDPTSLLYGVGITPTGIGEAPEVLRTWEPLLDFPD